jgi:uncharacterized protein YcbK (DUF882 family)
MNEPWGRFFKREDFACKCGCGQDAVDAELMHVLRHLRIIWGKPLIPLSANRCPKHNKSVGGAENSQHLYSKAVDFYIKEVTPQTIADELNAIYPDKYGIGVYNNRIHLDVRPNKARWEA